MSTLDKPAPPTQQTTDGRRGLVRWSAHWFALLFAIVVCATWFSTLGSRALLESDEGRYAEIPREMLVSGDWLTPRLNGFKFLEKPPLQIWGTTAAYHVLGVNEFSARCWAGITGLAGIALLWFAVSRLFNRETGLMAAAILASSMQYMVIGHVNTLDMGLSFFLTAGVWSFLLALHAPNGSRTERHWMWACYAALALAFLSKGLIAFALPALTLLVYTFTTRDFSLWRRLHLMSGMLIIAVIDLPWLIAAQVKTPEFLQYFFLHEQVQRYLTTIHKRDAPWWYFLPLLALGALPWSSLLFSGIKQTWQTLDAQTRTRRFLMIWIITVVGFFSLSHSKLPTYITPVFPAVATLTAIAVQRLALRRLQQHLLVIGSTVLLLGLAVWLGPDTWYSRNSLDTVRLMRPWVASGFAVIGCATLTAAWLAHRMQRQQLIACLGLTTLMGLSLLIQSTDALHLTRSSNELAAQLKPLLRPDTTLYSVRNFAHSLPFYLGRTLTLVEHSGEMEWGMQLEPQLAIADLDTFITRWQQDPHPIAIVRDSTYQELQQRGVPMQIVAQQTRLLAVSKPPAP